MMLCKWRELPENMKIDEVKPYYDSLYKHRFQLTIKRIADIVISSVLIMLIWPIFLIIAIAIKIDSPGPVFYRQLRVGQYGKLFRIFKFRSMVSDADKNGSLVTVQEDKRITKVGKFIRKYRLDEISQLFDVFRGTMTFVGTRPEVPRYVSSYSKPMMATLLLPPGITSMASIKFRSESEMLNNDKAENYYIEKVLPRKMEINLKEIKGFNLCNDFLTMIKTVIVVVRDR